MSSQGHPCSEKIRLVADYGAAVAAHYAAVGKLEQGMITGSAEIYQERRRASEDVRVICDAARKALDEHVAEHGC
jgi:hypothetical protein